MRVYFTASQPCALRLGGAMLGFCGGHEKFVDVDPESKTLAEFIPENADLLPADLVLEKSFFQSPPAFCDVYRYGFAVHLHIREFSARYSGISVLAQERVCGALVTLYKNGGIQLSIEKTDGFYTESLPAAFADAQIFSETVGGKELIFLAAAFYRTPRGNCFLQNLHSATARDTSQRAAGNLITAGLHSSPIPFVNGTALRRTALTKNFCPLRFFRLFWRGGTIGNTSHPNSSAGRTI